MDHAASVRLAKSKRLAEVKSVLSGATRRSNVAERRGIAITIWDDFDFKIDFSLLPRVDLRTDRCLGYS
ncbi:hypothetical protein K239x_00430 [Planctomycetes bacterium K23_9]|uniref:Uncharacterized protein n=1 Tax=Stieleria marina TaxID=1930275 RepID=A0A517NLV4_9BACT|nr:hypothetical protein K239x_00430 [Planctomycetes bacterium K23_9]